MVQYVQKVCALRDVAWIRTTAGAVTVREALIRAHEIAGLDLTLNGIQVGAQLRTIIAVAALVERQGRSQGKFDPAAVDAAIAQVSDYTNLVGGERPFLQVGVREDEVVTGPVKKLFPWMPGDRAEEFWSANTQLSEFTLEEATLALAVNYNYSFSGNNKIRGSACVNGSPGIRFQGVGNTVTEMYQMGESLYHSVCRNLPKSWVVDGGLPAWADPNAVSSLRSVTSTESPLWAATWGSNSAQCQWLDGNLVHVNIGRGQDRPPTAAVGKDGLKAWWDARDELDPFYLYISVSTNAPAQPKAFRLDLGKAETELSVDWNAQQLSEKVRRRALSMAQPSTRKSAMIFLRHLVDGSASSPVVRRSEIFTADPNQWMLDEDRSVVVAEFSKLVKGALIELTKPFTPKGGLKAIYYRKPDLEQIYWHRVTEPFHSYLISGDSESANADLLNAIRQKAMESFDELMESVPLSKFEAQVYVSRSKIFRELSRLLNPAETKDAGNYGSK